MTVVIGVISSNPVWVLPRHHVDRLREEFPQHEFLDVWDRASLREVLPKADVAFAAVVEPDLVPALTRLRWLQVPAAGVGHVLSPALVASPILVTSARGVRARAMAEHVVGVTLALARALPLAFRRQAEHVWAAEELDAPGRVMTIQGRRLGLVGLGAIGVAVADLASALGMSVWATRRTLSAPAPACVDRVLAPSALHDLLAASDVVVLATALTTDTTELIDDAALRSMKRGALLVNVGRGRLIDEGAVMAALRDGRLGGAALDVFASEPLPADSPWWDLPNVIVTPHTSGAMEDYWSPLVRLFADNLHRFDRGEPLVNAVDKQAGY